MGYWDGDLATPLASIQVFMHIFVAHAHIDMVFGSRVALLGRDIQRHASRHYLGRIFATLASWLLELRIYDTQCGAKLFRSSTDVQWALTESFENRWIFDVELIARLKVQRQHTLAQWGKGGGGRERGRGSSERSSGSVLDPMVYPAPPLVLSNTIYESPLDSWKDISGSKLSLKHKASALYGLYYIWRKYSSSSPLRSWDPATGESSGIGDWEGDMLMYGVVFVAINTCLVWAWCCCLCVKQRGGSSDTKLMKVLKKRQARKKND